MDSLAQSMSAAAKNVLYARFNAVVLEFLQRLQRSLPDMRVRFKLQQAENEVRAVLKLEGADALLVRFRRQYPPHLERIARSDDTFFTECADEISFLRGLDLADVLSKISDASKKAIWAYIHKLVEIAESCAKAEAKLSNPELMQDITQRSVATVQEFFRQHQGVAPQTLQDIQGLMQQAAAPAPEDQPH
jgi:hypothetical protein